MLWPAQSIEQVELAETDHEKQGPFFQGLKKTVSSEACFCEGLGEMFAEKKGRAGTASAQDTLFESSGEGEGEDVVRKDGALRLRCRSERA